MTLFIISLLAGILTVLAPCVLPLLPVVIGRSIVTSQDTEKKNSATVIILSLAVSIFVFTFILKVSTAFISIPQSFWTYLSGGILIVFGLSSLFGEMWASLMNKAGFDRASNNLFSVGYKKKSFLGDVIIGASLGPIFSTCSPTYFIILATVLPANFAQGILYLAAYIFGLCLVLFGIAVIGQKFANRLNILANPNGWFKKLIGVIFLMLGLLIVFGADKIIEEKILASGFFDITTIEQKLLRNNDPSAQTDIVVHADMMNKKTANTRKDFIVDPEIEKLLYTNSIVAPEISTPDGFINTNGKPIKIADYRNNHIVVLDIWTYSCINCKRTLPYLKDWYAKYHDQGLEIIGLHTPEFAFEKKLENVQKAVADEGITYPVVLDNDYSTWRELGNQYWPRKYVIDTDGTIVYDHIGEGGYAEMEQVIQYLLKKDGLAHSEKSVVTTDIAGTPSRTTPEIYFGSARNGYYCGNDDCTAGTRTFVIPKKLSADKFYLSGTWNIVDQFARLESETGTLSINYTGKAIHMVHAVDADTKVSIYEDGTFLHDVMLSGDTLTTLSEHATSGKHTIEIKFKKSKDTTFDVYTFTFS